MKTTRIYALIVILIVFGCKAFGQEHEQLLPKSMVKIGINAFLTQEVKSSQNRHQRIPDARGQVVGQGSRCELLSIYWWWP